MGFQRQAKNMWALIMGVLLIAGGNAFAQPQMPSVSDRVAKMKQELGLTDEQVSEITPVIEDEMSQMKELRSSSPNRDVAKVRMESIRKDTESKLSEFLTPEQLTKWKTDRQRSPRGGGGRGFGGPGSSSGGSGAETSNTSSTSSSSGSSRSTSGSGIW